MKKMRHCPWCGEELGMYDENDDELETCGKKECYTKTRNKIMGEEEEAGAEKDHYLGFY